MGTVISTAFPRYSALQEEDVVLEMKFSGCRSLTITWTVRTDQLPVQFVAVFVVVSRPCGVRFSMIHISGDIIGENGIFQYVQSAHAVVTTGQQLAPKTQSRNMF